MWKKSGSAKHFELRPLLKDRPSDPVVHRPQLGYGWGMANFAPQCLSLNNVSVVLDHSGALFVPDIALLVFSDLHFEKGSSFAVRQQFLPPYDTRKTLSRMKEVIARFKPQKIMSLGDAFHDTDAQARMVDEDFQTLLTLNQQHDWIWITGNHDPEPPKALSGQVCETLEIGGLHYGHEPEKTRRWQIAGHMHPAAKVATQGKTMRRPCFVTDGHHLILPAFGAFTGGLNILDPVYKSYLSPPVRTFLLGNGRTYEAPANALRPDGGSGSGSYVVSRTRKVAGN